MVLLPKQIMTICRWTLVQFFLILLALLICQSAFADNQQAQSGVSAQVNVEPEEGFIGDIFTVSILIRHDSILTPDMPKVESFPGFKVVDSGSKTPETFAGQMESEYWIRLQAEKVGKLTIPSLPISLYLSDGPKEDDPDPAIVMTPQSSVDIKSIIQAQEEPPTEIKDIKPLVEIERNWWPWVIAGLALLGLLIALYFLWKKWQCRSPVPASPPKRQLLPHELAMRELDALRAKGLLEAGQIQEYYFGLSEIFRRYLEFRYGFPALDWTTEEIIGHLHKVKELDSRKTDQLLVILRNTDQVKFAKANVHQDDNETQSIILFIQSTRLIPHNSGGQSNLSA
jgi:hypothetical protein